MPGRVQAEDAPLEPFSEARILPARVGSSRGLRIKA
jgi:hypothetical protein